MTVLAAGRLFLAARRNYRPLLIGVPRTRRPGAGSGWTSPLPPATPDPAAPRVRVVQPNIGQEGVGDRRLSRARAGRIARAAAADPAAPPRLLVWPEGTVNYYVEDGYPDTRYYGRGDPRWRTHPDRRAGSGRRTSH